METSLEKQDAAKIFALVIAVLGIVAVIRAVYGRR